MGRIESGSAGFRHRLATAAAVVRRRMPLTPLAALIALALALSYVAGIVEPLDRVLLDHRYSLLKRPASGSLVVVEIDARSIQALQSWPWPRRLHAEAIDRLLAAGAEQIAIDIDFSARSNPVDDEAFAAAIARAGSRLVLPTFAQGASARDLTSIAESAPLPQLLSPGTQVGSVNVISESDGRIWRYVVGLDVTGGYRPSLALLLAGNARPAGQAFHIDYSIREDTIATLSFIDILTGNFDPAAIANRKVIIGATAAELGDIQAVPVYRNLAGVFVQALAYETIVQGRAIARTNGFVTVVGLFALMPVICLATRRQRVSWQRSLLVSTTLAIVIVALSVIVQETAALSLDVATWLCALAAWSAAGLIRTLQGQSRRLMRRHVVSIQQRRMMRAIVEASFDGIIVVDEADRIAHANPTAERILGRPATELIGAAIQSVLPEAMIAARREPCADGDAPREHALDHGDGRITHIELVARALSIDLPDVDAERQPSQRVMVLTFRDVTDRRRALIALREALVEAQSASRLKSEFLAAMSHELRTPLHSILGFSELIRDRRLGTAIDSYVDYAGEIHSSGQRLSAMVEGMLDFALAMSGKLKLDRREVELAPTLERVVDSFARDAREKGLVLSLGLSSEDESLLVHADRRRVRDIAGHLLSNAIKFTPAGGSVTIRALRRQDAAGFEVRDTGIGMSQAQIATALTPLTQVDGRLERSHEGAGLGLSLAQKLVELHGGELSIRSAPGEGTSIEVWLPVADREPERAAA